MFTSTSNLFLAFVVLTFAFDDSKAACSKPCPFNWIRFRNHCYRLVHKETTWSEAEDHCQRLSHRRFGPAHLVSIHNEDEYQFILGVIQVSQQVTETGAVWIGLNDIKEEGQFVWSDGSVSGSMYSNWYRGQPDNFDNADCGALFGRYGLKWDDQRCHRFRSHFVCKSDQLSEA